VQNILIIFHCPTILTERLIGWFSEIKDELEIREKERNTK